MKTSTPSIQERLLKAKNTGFLSEEHLQKYKEDLIHLMVVISESEEIVHVTEEKSNVNQLTLFFLSQKKISREFLEKLLKDVNSNSIKNWVCDSFNTGVGYQKIEVFY